MKRLSAIRIASSGTPWADVSSNGSIASTPKPTLKKRKTRLRINVRPMELAVFKLSEVYQTGAMAC